MDKMAQGKRDYADFDRTCFDFLAMTTAEPTVSRSERLIKDVDLLKKLVPGEVEWDKSDQIFYLTEGGKRLPFPLVA